jgi:hypothetical protein
MDVYKFLAEFSTWIAAHVGDAAGSVADRAFAERSIIRSETAERGG